MNELPNPRQAKIQAFSARLMDSIEVDSARAMADEAFSEKDPALKMSLLSLAATMNPLAVPHLPPTVKPTGIFTLDAWSKSIAMARMVAANTTPKRILVASAPKTGSTFLASALHRTYDLSRVSLTLLSAWSYGHSQFGGALRDHDVDELALLTTSYAANGYVAHHHMIATPYLGKQAEIYGITPILTRRNLFDTLVSFDDHVQKFRGDCPYEAYLHFGVSDGWYDMEFDDRMEFLLDSQLHWYSRYYASWRLSQAGGHIDPLWIDYEKDILGPKDALAAKLVARLKAEKSSIATLTAELEKNGGNSEHFNKGVAGRGGKITGKNRQRIEDFIHRFKSTCDLTDLLDE